jgi:hypothetical protein
VTASTRSTPLHFDPFLGDAALRRPYRLLHGGRWDELDAALAEDPIGWPVPCLLASDDAAVETVILERYATARPSGRSLSLLGGALARDAFAARQRTTEAAFADALRRAEEIVVEAMRLAPELADPWVHHLAIGRGLGVDLRELRRRFEAAHDRAPFRPDACHQYLLGLSSRAGGVDSAMFDFAHWVLSEAPRGSPATAVLPTAHLEYGLSSDSPRSLTDHLTHPATAAELAPALADFIWHTPSETDPPQLPTLNAFALAMTVNDQESAFLVRECFRRIADRPTSYPWTLYHDEEIPAVFTEVKRVQLRQAERFAR